MKQPHCYAYPRPALTTDILLLSRDEPPRILLIQRKHEPFAGSWALPGGFVEENEDPDDCARRELQEETGIDGVELEQFHVFGKPGRDPRGWTVSVAYLARVDRAMLHPRAGDDAAAAEWHRLDQLPALAFDHEEIVALARKRLA